MTNIESKWIVVERATTKKSQESYLFNLLTYTGGKTFEKTIQSYSRINGIFVLSKQSLKFQIYFGRESNRHVNFPAVISHEQLSEDMCREI